MEELSEFGLTKNEIKIYLELLKLGTASPAEMAEKTGFSRSYVYDALERMMEKQIVSSVLRNNKKHFSATKPERLEERAKQKLEKIQKIIPMLAALQKSSKEDVRVELHKGTHVYKTLMGDITSSLGRNDEILIFGIDDRALMKLDPHYLTNLNIHFSALKKKNIKEKVIVKEGAKILKKAKTTAYRFLPKETIGNTAFEVYGNKVAVFIWGSPNCLILIENKEAALSYKKQFNLLWKTAKSNPRAARKKLL